MRSKAFLPLVACCLAAGPVLWWLGYKVGYEPVANPTDYPSERTIRIASHNPNFIYREFRVELTRNRIIHAEGTHYILERGGRGLAIKDGARDLIVLAVSDKDLVSIEEER